MLARHTLPFALCLALTAAAADSPFEGKWELDKKKTQATGTPQDLQLEMEQNGNDLVVRAKYDEPKNAIYPLMWVGIMTSELPLTTDGSEKTNQIGPFTHVSKTRIEGNQMITDFTAAMESGSVEGQWIRTVSPDRREMTFQVKSKASDGRTMDQTLVFKRK